ncbi:cytochrome b/b6 domain-containing protein [Sphingomonas sp.]|jgi:Ni/Fe-hydrogenase b-type cytochrome subunit|uniref:cytochrome b/b6 domain-containing protein n=1 Tax=Sphingomonas sp. TaxID=28214 RepID=UPI002DEE8E27|nr:cytochrome b/b6 domain-containing protein [Sphingomonas sp.]HEV2567359.1 cytochrome b/b6 domain-containing protein [Sphingomonas sp.]
MPPAPTRLIYRHKLATRIWHWVNAVTIIVLLMSGAMIFNAHPRLYWGHYGANSDPAWLQIASDRQGGYLRIGETRLNTDGVLGRWTAEDGSVRTNAFPSWATIPSNYNLALARRWHLAFALVLGFGLLAFLIASLFNRHIQKDLTLHRRELTPRHLWQDVVEHLKLRFHNAEDPGAFNVLQKLSYVGVIFILIPLVIFTGLAMSPAMDMAWPWLVDLFGGRQSARSIHFIVAALLLLFIVVHLVLVLLSGPLNGLRGMITGWLRVPEARP